MKKIEYFGAKWCSACKTVKPIVESLNSIKLEIIDVEQETTRAMSLNIRNIPVVRILSEEGLEIVRLVGNKTKEEIESYLI